MNLYPTFAPIPYFEELISCGRSLYSWTYSSSMTLLRSNCPHENVLHPLFLMLQRQTQKLPSFDRPVALSNSLGLSWIADFEHDGPSLLCLHVIGPVFHYPPSPELYSISLPQLSIPAEERQKLAAVLPQLPVLPILDFLQYGLMLHYTLTGEKILRGEFQYHNELNEYRNEEKNEINHRTAWLAEQTLLQQIEAGNLDYRQSAQRERLIAATGAGYSFSGDSLRQQKNTAITFTTLCACAAIRGGMPPETSQALREHYIKNIEACQSLSGLLKVNAAMQDDFVQRVYQQKRQTGISPQILQCCNYIQLHIGERIQLKTLARHVGYAESYLTQKFRREMGQTLGEYTLSVRMERAKDLLAGSLYSVQEISRLLGYTGPSYFSEQFKRYTGQSPTRYRQLRVPSF